MADKWFEVLQKSDDREGEKLRADKEVKKLRDQGRYLEAWEIAVKWGLATKYRWP